MKHPSIIRFSLALVMAVIWALLEPTSYAQWIAFNDHAEGAGTHLNATRYHIVGAGDGTNGPLKNILTGDFLSVTLTVSRTGLVLTDTAAANPVPGTPLYNAFNGYVDFTGSETPNIILISFGTVTYTLEGLDPTKDYFIRASAVRGGDVSFSNRWTLCELVGADEYVNAHSDGVLTSAQVPALPPNHAALNTGINNTADSGDLVAWQAINPGADGVIQIVCRKYAGTVPGGSSSGSAGYALTGLYLNEYIRGVPPVILEHPSNQVVEAEQPASFTVKLGSPADAYQWLRDGVPIPGATNALYTLENPSLNDSGARFSARVSNQFGTATSDQSVLIVFGPALITTPVPFDHAWRYEDLGKELGTKWSNVNFDDSGWKEGPGALGYATTSSLPEPIRTTILPFGIITHYFRTTFVVSNAPTDFDLLMTHLIDDGAVVYLNGEEVFRVNMPQDPIDASTPASLSIGNANLGTVTLPKTTLNLGTNWLAVELHQFNTASSDNVFGLSVSATAIPPSPLSIASQPADVHVHQHQKASFSVDVDGVGGIYQWFKDGVTMDGPQDSTYEIDRVSFEDTGSYMVTVSNAWNLVQSEPAVLTVGEPVPIQILSEPGDQSTTVAEEVSFTVEFSGDTPHYVQWIKDGQPLPGATEETLTLAKPHFPDAGVYSVSVSNNFSATTTTPFTVTVQRHPRGAPGTLHRDFILESTGSSRSIARLKDGRILISSSFIPINGFPQYGLALISQDGALDETFHPEPGGSAYAMAIQLDGKILLGGSSGIDDGTLVTNLARLNPDGNVDHDFAPRPTTPGTVWGLALQSDGKVIAVGTGGDGAIYRYNTDGSLDFSDINTDGGDESSPFYYAAAVQPDDKILVGGRFQKFHGLDYRFLIRLHPDGTLDDSFLSGTNAPDGYVNSIQIHRGQIYISGSFASVSGVARSSMARLNFDGSVDPRFNPPVIASDFGRGPVLNFVIQPTGFIIVGLFTTVDDQPKYRVARLHADGSLDETFDVGLGPNERVYEAVMDLSGDIYLAGLFTEFNGEPRAGIAKIYGTGEPILDWQRTPEGHLQILWPGERDDLMLESAASVSGFPWTLVTEPTNKVQLLNATTITPDVPGRVYRLHAP